MDTWFWLDRNYAGMKFKPKLIGSMVYFCNATNNPSVQGYSVSNSRYLYMAGGTKSLKAACDGSKALITSSMPFNIEIRRDIVTDRIELADALKQQMPGLKDRLDEFVYRKVCFIRIGAGVGRAHCAYYNCSEWDNAASIYFMKISKVSDYIQMYKEGTKSNIDNDKYDYQQMMDRKNLRKAGYYG